MSDPTNDALNAAHPNGAITTRDTPMEAGLRAVREMQDAPAPANEQNSVVSKNTAEKTVDVSSHLQAAGESPAHAPDAAGRDALLPCPFCGDRGVGPQDYGNHLGHIGRFIQCISCGGNMFRAFLIGKDDAETDKRVSHAWNQREPATSRIRALEKANRALVEALQKIAGGRIDGAVDLALSGNWQEIHRRSQAIAQEAIATLVQP